MKLEIGNFYVKDIVFGDSTSFSNGILTVNEREAIQALNPDGLLKNVKLHVAHPGESIRILPIKEVVEARVRPDGRATFPGYTGGMAMSGNGVVYALKNMAVTAVGKYAGVGDGMLDMSGKAAELTHLSSLIHLCFTAENIDPSEDGEQYKTNSNYRLGAHLLAQYVAGAVLGQEPSAWETFDFDQNVSDTLPRVGLVLQISSAFVKKAGYSTILYGSDCMYLVPTILHPTEVLDGALCSDSLFYASFKECTYDYQNFPILKELYAEHGKSLNLVCLILDVNDAMVDKKERASNRIAAIAELMKLDSAIVIGTGNGHSEIDFFTTIIKLEEKHVKCVGVCQESPGHGGGMQSKVMLDSRADAIVSVGCDHTVMELPPMETIIGDLYSIGRDLYPGAWAYDAELGPSLREDHSLIIDSLMILGHDGNLGDSHKTVKNF